MNKPVVGGVGGAGIGIGARGISGPTAAAAQAAAQKQKVLTQRADTDINTILDNFSHLVKAARVNDAPFRNSQEAFQMEIHASRVVQAADSLLKLVSELKQTAVFSDFASLNEHVQQRVSNFEQQSEETDRLLSTVAEQAATSLKELESHYYSSIYRKPE
ncbi:mediator of RNA polymerase II transcription subunit 22a [Cryptomeria japonica]|uniref:mediator of RNA polymerase II transcription subunit 22a n=1 Tax=Cryptomeria japonica TaxID=3369 RepID=UPI0027D9F3F7|nr:mediator of RNA polymerase II transcription subunit 22a [Cryptomeria japonica]XP_057825684.2 mediator of RNA polymerase II transcription subunit 22a [Cryptomeria japonica]XP_057825685.2 mediator of RNA polymerase II transcription subunit 22a [Cryptomeria japonica]